METESVKLLAAALALLPLFAVALSLGKYFTSIVEAIGRNPSAAPIVQKKDLIYFALIEAIALFSLAVSFIILKGGL